MRTFNFGISSFGINSDKGEYMTALKQYHRKETVNKEISIFTDATNLTGYDLKLKNAALKILGEKLGTITVWNITMDGVITDDEVNSTVEIQGSVRGGITPASTVYLEVNGNEYTSSIAANGLTYRIEDIPINEFITCKNFTVRTQSTVNGEVIKASKTVVPSCNLTASTVISMIDDDLETAFDTTDDKTPIINGKTLPNCTHIKAYSAGSLKGSAQVNRGFFSCQLSTLGTGNKTVTIKSYDILDNEIDSTNISFIVRSQVSVSFATELPDFL